MPNMITLRISNERRERLDALVAGGSYPNRAAVLTEAIDRLLADEMRQAIDQAIVEGYTRIPSTAAEDEHAVRSTRESIQEEPW